MVCVLGISIVVEGVECKEEVLWLCVYGCDVV